MTADAADPGRRNPRRGPLQRTPEWYAARRQAVTSTDIASILGVSKYKSEGDIAREKTSTAKEPEPDIRRFRIGRAMEDVIRGEDVIEHGVELRRVRRLLISSEVEWAVASADYERIGERCLVEIKTSTGREWEYGLPDRVEAQVRWQMGVGGYPAAHVATLRYGRDLVCHDLTHDETVWRAMLAIAADFRSRLAAGGPFAETRESGRRAWPLDDGSVVDPDAETVEAVADLLATRAKLGELTEREERLVAAIQARMGPASEMRGPGWRVTWKKSKDRTEVNWRAIADGLLRTIDPEDRVALIGVQTTTKTGARPFVVRPEGERDDVDTNPH